MSSLKNPWELHPDLTEERLQIIAGLLHDVRNGTISDTSEPEKIPWGVGCLIYDKTRNCICENRVSYSWLDVVDASMAFIFSIGTVPIRFYKGLPEDPSGNILARRNIELNQMAMAFGENHDNVVWRFAVDTDIDGKTLLVSFVGLNENNDVVSRWDQDARIFDFETQHEDFTEGVDELESPEVPPRTGASEEALDDDERTIPTGEVKAGKTDTRP